MKLTQSLLQFSTFLKNASHHNNYHLQGFSPSSNEPVPQLSPQQVGFQHTQQATNNKQMAEHGKNHHTEGAMSNNAARIVHKTYSANDSARVNNGADSYGSATPAGGRASNASYPTSTGKHNTLGSGFQRSAVTALDVEHTPKQRSLSVASLTVEDAAPER